MKQGSVLLLIVFVISVIISGLIAGDLHKKEYKIAKSRDRVSTAPLAGFQKFAADVEWMRFIQYCGGIDNVNDENAPEIARRVNQIIGFDPDFGRAYYEGALILSVKAPEKALKILDKGIANPRLKKMWKIPLLAGSIVMRPEMDKYYKGKPMDLKKVKKAEAYYRKALSVSGHPKYTLNCVMRTESILLQSNEPKEVKELEVWYKHWKKSYSMGGGLEMGMMGEGDPAGGVFGGEDLRTSLINALRKAQAAYPNNARVLELKKIVLKSAFNTLFVDPDTLTPYGPGERFSATTGKPLKEYGVCTKCHKILKGPYCVYCGADNHEAWKKMHASPENSFVTPSVLVPAKEKDAPAKKTDASDK